MANVLVNLTTTLALGVEESITISIYDQWVVTPLVNGGVEEVKTIFVYKIYENLIDYLKHEMLPSRLRCKTEVQRRASFFLYYKGTLH